VSRSHRNIDVDQILGRYGIHPLDDPLGDSHHSDDEPLTDEDRDIGRVAWYLGKLFSEEEFGNPKYMNGVMTSVSLWEKVARALRIHGLAIRDRHDNPLARTEGQAAEPTTEESAKP
jgi:hypothetical protein